MAVPVLDKNKKPLMPCSEKRARKMMGKNTAKPFWVKGVFCIIFQFLYQMVILKVLQKCHVTKRIN